MSFKFDNFTKLSVNDNCNKDSIKLIFATVRSVLNKIH